MTDITDPDLTPAAWACALDDEQLAMQLDRLANDPHILSGRERRAILNECARALRGER